MESKVSRLEIQILETTSFTVQYHHPKFDNQSGLILNGMIDLICTWVHVKH